MIFKIFGQIAQLHMLHIRRFKRMLLWTKLVHPYQDQVHQVHVYQVPASSSTESPECQNAEAKKEYFGIPDYSVTIWNYMPRLVQFV